MGAVVVFVVSSPPAATVTVPSATRRRSRRDPYLACCLSAPLSGPVGLLPITNHFHRGLRISLLLVRARRRRTRPVATAPPAPQEELGDPMRGLAQLLRLGSAWAAQGSSGRARTEAGGVRRARGWEGTRRPRASGRSGSD